MDPHNPEFERWSNALDDYPPKAPGIYAIFISNTDDGERVLYYIGSSGNLRARFTGHGVIYNIKRSGLVHHFLYIELDSPETARGLEFDFIGAQRPLLNIKMQRDG